MCLISREKWTNRQKNNTKFIYVPYFFLSVKTTQCIQLDYDSWSIWLNFVFVWELFTSNTKKTLLGSVSLTLIKQLNHLKLFVAFLIWTQTFRNWKKVQNLCFKLFLLFGHLWKHTSFTYTLWIVLYPSIQTAKLSLWFFSENRNKNRNRTGLTANTVHTFS
jgi:hypothetical protein